MNNEIQIQVIEPPIYTALNWDKNKIMSALEYLRMTLPKHLIEVPSTAQYFLIKYGDKNGNLFPAIGVGSDSSEVFSKIPDFFDLFDRVETIVTEVITISRIKQELSRYKTISWETLKEIGYYPNE